jgi:hypothetical protein
MSKSDGLLSSDEGEKSKPASTEHGALHGDGFLG